MQEEIIIKGAEQHNLKHLDVTIPRDKLVVITGLSGSGKSSLAFDTLYAEGQRRYVESLSAYARQFLDLMAKPKLEHISGLSPAIAIEQRVSGGTPRSTVATVTEIYDYLRLLYTHTGLPHCPDCGRPLRKQSAQEITNQLMELAPGSKMTLLAPVVSGRKGEHQEVFKNLQQQGYIRVRLDGKYYLLEDEDFPVPAKTKRHDIDVVIDRLITGKTDAGRMMDSVETALKTGNGVLTVQLEGESAEFAEEKFCENLACPDCRCSFGELLPRNFSFNSPYGACPECNGLGEIQYMDPAKVVPDPTLSLKNGAIPTWRRGSRNLIMYYNFILKKLAEHFDDPAFLTTPFNQLPEHQRKFLMEGSGEEHLVFEFRIKGKKYRWDKPFEGVLENLRRRLNETESDSVRERLTECLSPKICPACQGKRLNPVSLGVTVGGLNIAQFNALSVKEAGAFMAELPEKLNTEQAALSGELRKEIASRLKFLSDVGLDYLTLNRVSSTLSGGEAQRIRLATQLGCGLVGVMYILDEPSIGLHQRDNEKLLQTLEMLRDSGNSVIVVEHDLETIQRADYVLDLGPGAGEHGGELVAQGKPEEIGSFPRSLTGDFLSGRRKIAVPDVRCSGNGKTLSIKGADFHNLKQLSADFPLGCFIGVTGVSGSGKSSLINGILVPALLKHCGIEGAVPGSHRKITGLEHVDKAIVIDQSPIGRTPRSNPATYTGAFDLIRKLFAGIPEAKVRGYLPGRFSFNVKGGRCEACRGDGIKKIEMQFLSDVYVECSVCHGRRFNDETLEVHYKKHNIAQVLDLTVDQALELFDAIAPLKRKLKTLQEVGLGYIKLGQPATTLSGGEAQRVKLAAELARVPRGHTVYILDEPTTGLHLADIDQLLKVLFRLRDLGNTVIVIEHNLDVIKTCDHLIDLGPEGGSSGGTLVGCGTPEELAENPASHTGKFLKSYLE